MAKKPKPSNETPEVKEPEIPETETEEPITETETNGMGMEYGYGTPEDLEERDQMLEDSMRAFDPAKSITLPMNWNGDYTFRIMPLFKHDEEGSVMEDWLVPFGYHWNVFPTGDPKKGSKDGCPRMGYYDPDEQVIKTGPCPICDAIDRAIAEKRATRDDFAGKGGITVQKKYYLRVLLVDVALETKVGGTKPPVFDELPMVKLLEVPTSAAKILRARMMDKKKFGFQRLTHPDTGLLVCITRDDEQEGSKMYDVAVLPDQFAIPDEFIGRDGKDHFWPTEDWPQIPMQLPVTTPDDLFQKIQKHQLEINKWVANYTLAIDAESRPIAGRRALPPGQQEKSEDPLPSRAQSVAELRARMAARQNK